MTICLCSHNAKKTCKITKAILGNNQTCMELIDQLLIRNKVLSTLTWLKSIITAAVNHINKTERTERISNDDSVNDLITWWRLYTYNLQYIACIATQICRTN